MTAKKAVLQLSIHEEKIRKKAIVTVSRFSGVTSITMDDKSGKLTVVGEVDVPVIVMKLRKLCHTDIVSVDDVKPPEKKPEPEKPAPPIPAEFITYPMNYAYQYNPHHAYANSYYYQPYGNCRVVDEPNCVIM
ncbi:unnamed protein product [Arabidopsis arenosa]|uniref:HMA domain-containing protein n=2 Tax=Arabidopsis TaxID=3701 RepID=A0A8T1XSI0_ARASU|nr:hypothetical protein ISN44_As13g015390 [Arabidopsis suecica]CAE6236933.1 unnamed protein product [Arabidopsis arenosa]